MNKLLCWMIGNLLALTGISDKISAFVRDIERKIDQEAIEFAEEIPGLQLIPSDGLQKKCPRGGCVDVTEELSGDTPFKILMSFSVPENSWIALSKPLEKLGGAFVLRGLPEDSFQVFASKIIHLRNQGVYAPIIIDPDAYRMFGMSETYDTYQMSQAPSMCLTYGAYSDVVAGNIPVEEALRLFAEKGDTRELAKQYLKQLRGEYD